MDLFAIDWKTLFIPTETLPEMFLRGSLVYLFIIFLLRTVQKRHAGGLSSADFLFIVLMASSAHYALTGGQHSITFGLGVILTLTFWNITLNWLSFRFPAVKRFFNPPPLSLIRDGKYMKTNMRKEFITADELKTELRKHGVDAVEKVKEAHIESDGETSVIRYDPVNMRKKYRHMA